MQITLISADDMRQVRPISANVPDLKRLQPYIIEAETLDVMPILTPALYSSLVYDRPVRGASTVTLKNSKNKPVTISIDEYNAIFNATYFCNNTKFSQGITYAVAYLAYRRFIADNSINVTAFGVTVKKSEFSNPADSNDILRMSNSAKKIGLEYLNQTAEYCKHLGLIDCGKSAKDRKIIVIGQ